MTQIESVFRNVDRAPTLSSQMLRLSNKKSNSWKLETQVRNSGGEFSMFSELLKVLYENTCKIVFGSVFEFFQYSSDGV